MDPGNPPGPILAGVRVLDFGRFIAAPYCAALLGSVGAEVIRIEQVGGNVDRYVMPVTDDGEGSLFLQMNHNKRSLALDVRHARAREILHKLIATSDVVITNLVPKALKRSGLDYNSLTAIKPDIIATNVTAFGASDPDHDNIGFDGTGQAMSGAMYLGGVDGKPFRAAVSYVDYGTALAAAFGTMAAIHAKAKTGRGQRVDASLLGTALAMINTVLIEQASGRRTRVPIGNRSPIAGPSDMFVAQDGCLMVQVIGQQMFERWAKVTGAEHFISDLRFADDIGRGEHGEALSAHMAEWCRTRTVGECLGLLNAAQVPACPVLSPADVLKQPQRTDGGYFNWTQVRGLADAVPLSVPPVRLSQSASANGRVAPALGQDTGAILSELGYRDSDVAEFRRLGVV